MILEDVYTLDIRNLSWNKYFEALTLLRSEVAKRLPNVPLMTTHRFEAQTVTTILTAGDIVAEYTRKDRDDVKESMIKVFIELLGEITNRLGSPKAGPKLDFTKI